MTARPEPRRTTAGAPGGGGSERMGRGISRGISRGIGRGITIAGAGLLLGALLLTGLAAECRAAHGSAGGQGGGGASGTALLERRERIARDLVLISSLDSEEELLETASEGGGSSGKEHNPAAMFGFSLIVPGSGQLIQGEKRGYIYLLVELALVGGAYALSEQGLEERSDYEAFADAEWAREAYMDWYAANCEDCTDCGYECRPVAEYGTQEYYEDIGKYDTYWRWWNIDGDEWEIEWDGYSDTDVAVRNEYWGMRIQSNDTLGQSRYLLMAVLLNHVVSAADAFLIARGDQKEPPGDASRPNLGLEFDVADAGPGLKFAFVARY